MSDDVTINLNVDDSEGRSTIDRFAAYVDNVTREAKAKIKVVRRQILRLSVTFNYSISLIRGIFRGLGMTLDPLHDSLISLIQNVFNALMAAAAAYQAVPGIGQIIGTSVAIAAVFFSINQTIAVSRGMEQMAGNMRNISSILESITMLSLALGR